MVLKRRYRLGFRPRVEGLEDRCQPSVVYDEGVSGDLSNQQLTPTPVALGLGVNSIKGVVGGNDIQDWVTVHVPTGETLDSLVLASYVSVDGQGFMGVQRGTSFQGSPFSATSYLGYAHFGTSATNGTLPVANLVGVNILPLMGNTTIAAGAGGFTPPLAAGDYTFLIQQLGSGTTYQFDFVTSSPLQAITVTPANPSVSAGQTRQFTATGRFADNSTSDLTSQVVWSSSNTAAATITAGGLATAVATGTSTISAALNGVSGSTTLTTAANVPDLTVSSRHTGSFPAGGTGTYTLTVANVGQGPTTGAVTVVDTLPTGLSYTGPATVNGWTITTGGQSVTAVRSDPLAAGSSYPSLLLSVAVAGNAPSSVTNQAAVSGGGDVNAGNNAASDPTAITQPADMILFKTHAGIFRQGDAADVYTITARNVGAGPTAGAVTVVDTLPAGLSPTAADVGTINGWAVSFSGQTVTATRSDVLATGASYPDLNLTVAVSTTAPATVTNVASVSGGGESNTANDSVSDPTTIAAVADLTILKSHTGTFHPGDPADVYQITIRNAGAGATDGSVVTVVDTLPIGLTPTTANTGIINGWTVTRTGQVVTGTRRDVLSPGSAYPVLPVTVAVASTAPSTLVNTATVAGGGEVNTANDTATDSTTNTRVADLTILKSHGGTFRQGDTADTYTLTVNNIGSGPTVGPVTVVDTLPTGLTPVPVAGSINGWTVSVSGLTVTASRSDVLGGGTSYPPLVLTVGVTPTAPATVTNRATVSGGGEINTANDSVSDPTAVIQLADLTLLKSHAGSFRQGDAADTYTLTVRNAGAGPTVGPVTLVDTLPNGLTPTTANAGTINGWTVTINGQTVTATRADVLAGGAAYPALALTVGVARTAPAAVTNRATVSGGGEINTANDSVSDPTVITQVADLTLSMSHAGVFEQGAAAAVFNLVVRNVGPGPTVGPVTVTATLPTGLIPTAGNGGVVNGWTVSVSGQTVTATRTDPLAGGASYPVLPVVVQVAGNAPAGLTVSAKVLGGEDIDGSNNSAVDVVSIAQTSRRRGA